MVKGIRIALTGEMRSGKDTVGEYLVGKYGFKRLAFGDGIVETCEKLFPSEFKDGVKPRKLLQDFGQFCVSIDKWVWFDYVFNTNSVSPKDNIVITDLRQPHEYSGLVEAGFKIVRITADGEIRVQRIIEAGEPLDPETFNHSTEKFVKTFDVDYEVENNGTKEELLQQVDNLMKLCEEGRVPEWLM
jgi:dephospho-CoA kinase